MTARILYLDDNATNVKLMRMVVAMRDDTELTVAPDGASGLQRVRREQFDLVLIDLYLPDLRGDEVLRQLRADEKTARLPAAVVSAEDDTKMVRQAMDAGADAYITKPFDIGRLLATLDGLLAGPVGDRAEN